MTAVTSFKDKSAKTMRVFWLAAGALALTCLLPKPGRVQAQLPPPAAPPAPVLRPRHVTPATLHIGSVTITARLEYGNAGFFYPAKAQAGDWTGVTFEIVNYGRRPFVFNDKFVRLEQDDGSRLAADQSDTLHGTPWVTTIVPPNGESQSAHVGPYGYRVPVKRITYTYNKRLLVWNCISDKPQPAQHP